MQTRNYLLGFVPRAALIRTTGYTTSDGIGQTAQMKKDPTVMMMTATTPWYPINTLVSTEGNAMVVDDEEDD
jgi:hypothetical protein